MLDALLHAAYMVTVCRAKETAKTYPGYHAMDAMVGELDWLAELHRLQQEIKCQPKLTRAKSAAATTAL